jgi:hypothetical protein
MLGGRFCGQGELKMRALTVAELGFVSGGSAEGPQWGGTGMAKYKRLGALEIVIVTGIRNPFDGANDPGALEEICTGLAGAIGGIAGGALGGVLGIPVGIVGGGLAGGIIGYVAGGDVGAAIGIGGGAIVGLVGGTYAGVATGAIVGAVVGSAVGYYACGGGQ